VNYVEVVAESFDLAGFEIKRIVGDEDGGIGAALDFDGAANAEESAAAGADIVVRFVGFEVLILVVVLNVAAGEGFGSLVIVFDVIGAEALFAIVNVHVVVGDEEITFAALRAGGGEFRDAAFDGGRANLLGGSQAVAGGRKEDKQRRYPGKKGERGAMASMGVSIHAKNLNIRSCWMLARGFADV
jgi:hypothetical protein